MSHQVLIGKQKRGGYKISQGKVYIKASGCLTGVNGKQSVRKALMQRNGWRKKVLRLLKHICLVS